MIQHTTQGTVLCVSTENRPLCCEPLPEELMGITFHLCDAAGNWISESHGSHFEEDGLFYSTMEIQSFDELPETLYLEVNAIDGPSLGRVECKVSETDAPVVTAPHLNGF